MLLFRSEDEIDSWCSRRGVERGAVLTLQHAWELSKPWYGTRASPDYRGRTAADVEAILRSQGLDTPFWRFA